VDDGGEIPAGDFGAWLQQMTSALARHGESDVPCDGCTACCEAAQFVHVEPDEVETLARIPAAVLVPAPHRPRGHMVMGYDQDGRCPMLADGRCSIYEHRPRTCRTYDCRVLAAAGLSAEAVETPAISRRAARWRFDHAGGDDLDLHRAVEAAAAFVRDRARDLPPEVVPVTTVQRAVAAVVTHDLFLAEPDEELVHRVAVRLRTR
jgi:hypothetical protein